MKYESPDERDTRPLEITIPEDIEDDLLQTRRILLVGEINDAVAVYVNTCLRVFAIRDPNAPVYIYINSFGGDISAGYSIIDQMDLSPFDVYTVVQGQANSMAAIIALYGDDGCRFITKNSTMMFHSPILFSGSPEHMGTHKSSTDFHYKMFMKHSKDIASRLGMSHDDFLKILDKTWWIDAEEATRMGIVDGIWDFDHENGANGYQGEQNEKTKDN